MPESGLVIPNPTARPKQEIPQCRGCFHPVRRIVATAMQPAHAAIPGAVDREDTGCPVPATVRSRQEIRWPNTTGPQVISASERDALHTPVRARYRASVQTE